MERSDTCRCKQEDCGHYGGSVCHACGCDFLPAMEPEVLDEDKALISEVCDLWPALTFRLAARLRERSAELREKRAAIERVESDEAIERAAVALAMAEAGDDSQAQAEEFYDCLDDGEQEDWRVTARIAIRAALTPRPAR